MHARVKAVACQLSQEMMPLPNSYVDHIFLSLRVKCHLVDIFYFSRIVAEKNRRGIPEGEFDHH